MPGPKSKQEEESDEYYSYYDYSDYEDEPGPVNGGKSPMMAKNNNNPNAAVAAPRMSNAASRASNASRNTKGKSAASKSVASKMPPANRASKQSKAKSQPGGKDDDEYSYESYYEYEDEYEYEYEYEYDYDYEYEYEEGYEYEYEYEYEDEDMEGGNGMTQPKGTNEAMGMGMPMGGNPMMMAGPMMGISADMLAQRRAGLDKAEMNSAEDGATRGRAAGADRPFGITSANLGILRGNMNKVERTYEKAAVNQGTNYANNLRPGGKGSGINTSGLIPPKPPAWMNQQMRKGPRAMTVNIQKLENGEDLKAQIAELKAKREERDNRVQLPRFLNGKPTGRISVKRVRARVSTNLAGGRPAGPPGGMDSRRVSARVAVTRVQDPDDPTKFLTKNRVSYKVRKAAPDGRQSARVSTRVRKSVNGPGGDRQSARVRVSVRKPKDPNRVSRRSANGPNPDRVSRRSKNPNDPNRISRRSKNPNDPNRISRRSKNPNDPNRISRRSKSPNDPNRVSRRSKRVSRSSKNGSKDGLQRVSRRSKGQRVTRNGMPSVKRVSRRSAKDPNRVSRKKRPDVSRTSMNQNILGAKNVNRQEMPGVGRGDGCYLKIDPNNGGVLYAQWTVIGMEDSEALAFFQPETAAPRLFYKQNDGRSDLLSNVMSSKQRFCQGFSYFWALAKEYNGNVKFLGMANDSRYSFDTYALNVLGDLKMLNSANIIPISEIDAVAVLPPGSKVFNRMSRIEPSLFISGACEEGFAVKLR